MNPVSRQGSRRSKGGMGKIQQKMDAEPEKKVFFEK